MFRAAPASPTHDVFAQDLPLEHTDCDEFFAAMRDLVFVNRRLPNWPAPSSSSVGSGSPSTTASEATTAPSSSTGHPQEDGMSMIGDEVTGEPCGVVPCVEPHGYLVGSAL